jgi:hypothetical protein
MKWQDLKIGYKIGIGFSVMILVAAIIGAIAFYNMNKIQGETANLTEKYLPTINESVYLDKDWHELMQMLQAFDDKGDSYFIKKVRLRLEKFNNTLDVLIKATTDSKKLEATHAEFLTIKAELGKFSTMLDEYEKITIYNEDLLTKLYKGSLVVEQYAVEDYKGRNAGINELLAKVDNVVSHIYTSVYQKTPAGIVKSRQQIENLQLSVNGFRKRNRLPDRKSVV